MKKEKRLHLILLADNREEMVASSTSTSSWPFSSLHLHKRFKANRSDSISHISMHNSTTPPTKPNKGFELFSCRFYISSFFPVPFRSFNIQNSEILVHDSFVFVGGLGDSKVQWWTEQGPRANHNVMLSRFT